MSTWKNRFWVMVQSTDGSVPYIYSKHDGKDDAEKSARKVVESNPHMTAFILERRSVIKAEVKSRRRSAE